MANEAKTDLTPHERICAAYMYHIRKTTVTDLVIAYGGVNPARISNAAEAIGKAAGVDAGPRKKGRRKQTDKAPELALVEPTRAA